jgi:hypothetical protein
MREELRKAAEPRVLIDESIPIQERLQHFAIRQIEQEYIQLVRACVNVDDFISSVEMETNALVRMHVLKLTMPLYKDTRGSTVSKTHILPHLVKKAASGDQLLRLLLLKCTHVLVSILLCLSRFECIHYAHIGRIKELLVYESRYNIQAAVGLIQSPPEWMTTL